MKFPWYAHNIEDYDRKTAALSIIQHGAYRLLMDHYYRIGGPLEANASDLLRICRASDEAERGAVLWVLGKFFIERDGFYHNQRADEEIAKRIAISEKRASAGKKGGTQPKTKREPKAPANGEATPKQLLTQEHLHLVSSKEETTVGPVPEPTVKPKKVNNYPDDFEAFWQPYPRHDGMSKKDTYAVWVKLKKAGSLPADADMARAVAGYRAFLAEKSKGRSTPYPQQHAETWLRGQHYESYLEARAAPVGAVVANTGPGWEADYQKWTAVRKTFRDQSGSDNLWFNHFGGCRPISETELICRSQFEVDNLDQKFGDKLERLFGQRVIFRFIPATNGSGAHS